MVKQKPLASIEMSTMSNCQQITKISETRNRHNYELHTKFKIKIKQVGGFHTKPSNLLSLKTIKS